MTVLGLSTNTRLLGLAIIQNGHLSEYKVLLHKQPWSPAKVTQIIASLEPCVRRYSIKKVVLSIPHAHHTTKEWKYLAAKMEKYFSAKQIHFEKRSCQALYSLCSEGQKTKKTLMFSLAARFPELSGFYYKEMRNRNRYYTKLFEAVGMALLEKKDR